MTFLLYVTAAFTAGLLLGLSTVMRVVRQNRRFLDGLRARQEASRQVPDQSVGYYADLALRNEVKARFWFSQFENLRKKRRDSGGQEFGADDADWWKR
jgi:hypothetical protein